MFHFAIVTMSSIRLHRAYAHDISIYIASPMICLFAEREVWYEAATRAIETRIREAASTSVSGTTPPSGMARSVVLFVGDGMGMSTLTAARILAGQRHGNPGEETQLAWESFPAVALARVSTQIAFFFFIFFLGNAARKTVALRASNLLR